MLPKQLRWEMQVFLADASTKTPSCPTWRATSTAWNGDRIPDAVSLAHRLKAIEWPEEWTDARARGWWKENLGRGRPALHAPEPS